MGLHSKVCVINSHIQPNILFLQLTDSNNCKLIDRWIVDVPSVCQLCTAVSGDLIPPPDPDCNIML